MHQITQIMQDNVLLLHGAAVGVCAVLGRRLGRVQALHQPERYVHPNVPRLVFAAWGTYIGLILVAGFGASFAGEPRAVLGLVSISTFAFAGVNHFGLMRRTTSQPPAGAEWEAEGRGEGLAMAFTAVLLSSQLWPAARHLEVAAAAGALASLGIVAVAALFRPQRLGVRRLLVAPTVAAIAAGWIAWPTAVAPGPLGWLAASATALVLGFLRLGTCEPLRQAIKDGKPGVTREHGVAALLLLALAAAAGALTNAIDAWGLPRVAAVVAGLGVVALIIETLDHSRRLARAKALADASKRDEPVDLGGPGRSVVSLPLSPARLVLLLPVAVVAAAAVRDTLLAGAGGFVVPFGVLGWLLAPLPLQWAAGALRGLGWDVRDRDRRWFRGLGASIGAGVAALEAIRRLRTGEPLSLELLPAAIAASVAIAGRMSPDRRRAEVQLLAAAGAAYVPALAAWPVLAAVPAALLGGTMVGVALLAWADAHVIKDPYHLRWMLQRASISEPDDREPWVAARRLLRLGVLVGVTVASYVVIRGLRAGVTHPLWAWPALTASAAGVAAGVVVLVLRRGAWSRLKAALRTHGKLDGKLMRDARILLATTLVAALLAGGAASARLLPPPSSGPIDAAPVAALVGGVAALWALAPLVDRSVSS